MKKKILCSLFLMITFVVATGAKLTSEPSFFSKLGDLSKPAGIGVQFGEVGDESFEELDVMRSRLKWNLTIDMTVKATAATSDTLVRVVLWGGADQDGDGEVGLNEWSLLGESDAVRTDGFSVAEFQATGVGMYGVYCVQRYGAAGKTWTNSVGSLDYDDTPE